MLINYFKIAWRNLIKQPFYSFINIAGLGIGLLSVFFIFLYVKDELSYDQFHENKSQLYRLNFYAKLGEQTANTSESPGTAGPLFSKEFPEVESGCRVYTGYGDYSVKYELRAFRESSVASVDSTFADLFTMHTTAGNIKDALSHPGRLAMNVTTAKKYFGSSDPIGKTLTLENERPYQVAAVYADIPLNSHFQFNILLPLIDRKDVNEENWGSTNYHNYFLLRKGTDIPSLSRKMNNLFVDKFKIVLKQYLNLSWEEFLHQGSYARIELFPVEKIHLYSHLDGEIMPPGSSSQVYIFSLIGLLILLLACINFINLATARASMRAREVGVRKTVGALKSALAVQFLSESVLFSVLAGILGIAIMWILLPLFNQVAGKSLLFSLIFKPSIFVPIFLITMIAGISAGLYPALYLASLQPVKVLKGFASVSKKSVFRNGLVVFQFFISMVLIIGSFTIYKQLKYVQDKKLGFNKNQVLVINNFYLIGKNNATFKQQLVSLPEVKSNSISNFLPGSDERNTSAIITGKVPNVDKTVLANNWWTDMDFLKTMEIGIVDGRDFDKSILSDSTGVIVNETLARSFGYPGESILNKSLGLPQDEGKIKEHHIIGVMKDFNFQSLHHRIEPLVLFNGGGQQYMAIRLNTQGLTSTIKKIEAMWKSLAPGIPFEYNFMDDRYNQLYQSEQKTGRVSFIFSFLAIFIACIGLLGLATFTIQQRIKEIGIRKVLGASTRGIIGLMSRDFVLIIGLSICFAFPLAWYLMHRWLQGFEYRTAMDAWVFIGTGIGILVMAILIVSMQSLRAAWMNPVQSIRVE